MNAKQLILSVMFLIFLSPLAAQETTIVTMGRSTDKGVFWVGSLPNTSSGVYHKLKIEVFGGGWIYDDLATTTFTVSTRNKLVINREVHGKGTPFNLEVYKTSSGYDFVIDMDAHHQYVSAMIKSVAINNSDNMKVITPIQITSYSTSGKTNVTNQFEVSNIFVTNQKGYIGINNASPKYWLDVNGTIRAREIIVKTDGADFVFEDDYELPSLYEVASHIQENKHLPGIPSAKEMQENGVGLSDLNIKLLQKIEEQTLYILELNNRIHQLENKMQSLDNE